MKFSIGWFNFLLFAGMVSLFFTNINKWLFLTLMIIGILTLSTGFVAWIEISTNASVKKILSEKEKSKK